MFSCVVESSSSDRLDYESIGFAVVLWEFIAHSIPQVCAWVSVPPFELHCSIIQRNFARLVLQAAARGPDARFGATDVFEFGKFC